MNIAHVLSDVFTVPLVQTCTVYTSVFSSPRVHLQPTHDPDMTYLQWLKKKACIVTLCLQIMSSDHVTQVCLTTERDPSGRAAIHFCFLLIPCAVDVHVRVVVGRGNRGFGC